MRCQECGKSKVKTPLGYCCYHCLRSQKTQVGEKESLKDGYDVASEERDKKYGKRESESTAGEHRFQNGEWVKPYTFNGVESCISGKKESDNKLSYELDRYFIESMAKRMQQNKGKYPPYNRKKPMDIESLKQALLRHTIEVMKGNYTDIDDYDHLSAIACNAQFIYYQLKQCHTTKM